jgi:hypothetical protein
VASEEQKSDEPVAAGLRPAQKQTAHRAVATTFRSPDEVDYVLGEALLHKRAGHVVIGRRLRPLTYWHVACLDYVRSPFAGFQRKIDIAALDEATAICRTRYPNMPRDWPKPFAYLRRLYLARKYRLLKFRRRRLLIRKAGKQESPSRTGFSFSGTGGSYVPNSSSSAISDITSPFTIERRKFNAYLADYFSRPVYGKAPLKRGEENPPPSGSPWYLLEVATLRRFNSKLTWADAWNTPITPSGWEILATLEAHGCAQYVETPQARAASRRAEEKGQSRIAYKENGVWKTRKRE